MDLVSLQGSGIWIHAGELDVIAEVVPTIDAQEAVTTRNSGLNSDSVTYHLSARIRGTVFGSPTRLEVFHALAASNDNTSSFVADDAVTFKNERTYPSSLPEMHIRATRQVSHRGCEYAELGRSYPQIPVALM